MLSSFSFSEDYPARFKIPLGTYLIYISLLFPNNVILPPRGVSTVLVEGLWDVKCTILRKKSSVYWGLRWLRLTPLELCLESYLCQKIKRPRNNICSFMCILSSDPSIYTFICQLSVHSFILYIYLVIFSLSLTKKNLTKIKYVLNTTEINIYNDALIL